MPKIAIDTASSGSNTLVSGIANRKIRVLGYSTTSADTVTVTWESASTKLTGAISHVVGVPHIAMPGNSLDEQAIMECAAGEDLNLVLSAAKQVSGWLVYDFAGV